MPLLMLGALLAAAMAGPSSDSAVGHWRSPTKNAVIEIQRCGASLCGRLVSSDDLRADPARKDVNNKNPALRGRPLKNMLMLSGFRQESDAWVDGEVYNGADGRTYSGRITIVDANHLKLRGCVFVPLCKTETWTRLP
ncbi:DUF2147 domain-containing protein [Sphingomonas morindae]|uniref:DUF2147 domain-containing protein n=2 Tax=Sphingomonas morindae TaxID=1541170 RepID=A0ABY4XCT1_9SPHN|nr:DUF2147 domain-containing protein [Sphingomonas morindae]USI74546.1 DUF2147 domain-containing protein [Sphingomonas morindae]